MKDNYKQGLDSIIYLTFCQETKFLCPQPRKRERVKNS